MAVVILLVDEFDDFALGCGAAVDEELSVNRERDADGYKQKAKPHDQLASERVGKRQSGLDLLGHAHTVPDCAVDGRLSFCISVRKKRIGAGG
jgi:hypothetical protein